MTTPRLGVANSRILVLSARLPGCCGESSSALIPPQPSPYGRKATPLNAVAAHEEASPNQPTATNSIARHTSTAGLLATLETRSVSEVKSGHSSLSWGDCFGGSGADSEVAGGGCAKGVSRTGWGPRARRRCQRRVADWLGISRTMVLNAGRWQSPPWCEQAPENRKTLAPSLRS